MNLNPHTFDFAPNEFDVRHRQSPLVNRATSSKNKKRTEMQAARFSGQGDRMCNLYSITTNQAAIIALFRVVNRYVEQLRLLRGHLDGLHV